MSADLWLGGVRVPLHSVLDFEQSYSAIEGGRVLRMTDGAGVKTVHWRKISTTVSAGGWIPPGLLALDYDEPLVMRCAAPRAIVTAATVVTLPAARRTDAGHEPYAAALVEGDWQAAELDIAGDTATITPVAGAGAYRVSYYPELTVFASPPEESGDLTRADYRWSIEAEEV